MAETMCDPNQSAYDPSLVEAFDKALASLDQTFTEEQVQQFLCYFSFLLETNKSLNLTAITEPDEVAELHLLDSLSLLPYLDLPGGPRLIDVGTGAGLPAVPLLIARPDFDFSLLDARQKRLGFIQEGLEKLGLADRCQLIHGRAEEVGQSKDYRETFDLAIARAVAPLNVLLEYCLPLVKPFGYFIAMKGRLDGELEVAGKAMKVLGGDLADLVQFKLPESGAERSLVIVQKIQKSPSRYPRKAGKIKSNPL